MYYLTFIFIILFSLTDILKEILESMLKVVFFFLIEKNMGHIELIQSIKKNVRVIRITIHFSMIIL